MKHPRTHIRASIAQHLKNSSTAAGKNVFDSRAKPLFDQHLPALLVYTADERVIKSQYDGDGRMDLQRELELCVEAVCKGSEEVEKQLDDIALQIEEALDGYTIPNRQADIIKLKSTETDLSIDGNKSYGAIRLTFEVGYHTRSKKD